MSDLKLGVNFWCSNAGNEPVRSWLIALKQEDRKIIGQTILTVQYRWPLGMPTVKKIDANLWEVRIHMTNKCIARVFFTIFENNTMVLLHGFIKKSQRTPSNELTTARKRLNTI